MEIHNIHDSALFNEENYIAQSSTLDTSETDVVTQHNSYFERECFYTSAIEIRCGFNTPMHS